MTELTAHIDVLPTLASLCDLDMPNLKIDGSDVSKVILGEQNTINRPYLVTDSQRVQAPIKWRKSAVMSDKMRLVNGKELYDISKDPSQQKDLSDENPELVTKMRGFYDEWWSSVSAKFNQFPVIVVGSDAQNPIELTCHDTHVHDSKIPWNQDFIREVKKNPMGGNFTLEFEKSGKYKIEISRWPFESGLAMTDAVAGRPATKYVEAISDGRAMDIVKGGVQIGAWKQEKPLEKGAKSIVFEGNFSKGKTDLLAWFTTKDNEDWGAFYIRIEYLN